MLMYTTMQPPEKQSCERSLKTELQAVKNMIEIHLDFLGRPSERTLPDQRICDSTQPILL